MPQAPHVETRFYLAARTDAEVASMFRSYGLPESTVTRVAKAVRSDRRRWIEFMMKFELGLDKPDPARARASAVSIAGGLVPLPRTSSCAAWGPPSSYALG